MTTPSTAATIPKPGQRIGHGSEGVDRLHGLVVRDLHVPLHHLVHVERLHASGDGGAQGVADESLRMVVAEETQDTS